MIESNKQDFGLASYSPILNPYISYIWRFVKEEVRNRDRSNVTELKEHVSRCHCNHLSGHATPCQRCR